MITKHKQCHCREVACKHGCDVCEAHLTFYRAGGRPAGPAGKRAGRGAGKGAAHRLQSWYSSHSTWVYRRRSRLSGAALLRLLLQQLHSQLQRGSRRGGAGAHTGHAVLQLASKGRY